jgi:hypothetical protein
MQKSWIKGWIAAVLTLLSCQVMAADRVEIQIKGTVEPWASLSVAASDSVDLSGMEPQTVRLIVGFNMEKAKIVLGGDALLSPVKGPVDKTGSPLPYGKEEIPIKVSYNEKEITRADGPGLTYTGTDQNIDVTLTREGELEEGVEYEGMIPLMIVAN